MATKPTVDNTANAKATEQRRSISASCCGKDVYIYFSIYMHIYIYICIYNIYIYIYVYVVGSTAL